MTAACSFLHRSTREPLFVGDQYTTTEPRQGDIAMLHTLQCSMQVLILTARDRSYTGRLEAASARTSNEAIEVTGKESVEFEYSMIISLQSGTKVTRAH